MALRPDDLIAGTHRSHGHNLAKGADPRKMMAATLESFGDSLRSTNPLGRIGQDEDMAGIAIFLASQAGAYVTGTVIPVDGGMSTTT